MSGERAAAQTAGGAIFPRLKALGVDYVFCNAGTDFPPIIEGLAEAAARGVPLPRAVIVPHEHVGLGMAHGAWLATGRAQAVMLHTNVGLANGAIGAINAACDNVPILLMSGRTPATEAGRFGARTVPIAWGQEMRDQSALVREACKWDNELRFAEQIPALLDRAWAVANSTPKGPVYLSLPREVLCEPCPGDPAAPQRLAPATMLPDPAALAEAAGLLARAERPLVIAQRGAGDAAGFAALGDWASRWAMPVSSWWATRLAIPTPHPAHVGADPGPWLAEADAVLVIDSLAPWWPDRHPLAPGAKVIHLGPDPLFARFPTRGFACDIALAGETGPALRALFAAMQGLPRDAARLAARRARIAAAADRVQAEARVAAAPRAGAITRAFLSFVLGQALRGRPSAVFSELGTLLGPLERSEPGSWFQEPHSGGLGWCFPAALGAALADPGRLAVATMGDGSHIFANPVACHQVAEALGLAPLVVVVNNAEWGAVRASVRGLYPEGAAARANLMPLTSLAPSPDFAAVARASRGWARRVENPADLPGAIEAALAAIATEGRLALLDVAVAPD
jgi:acetolactate synthase-1/2/3 large subunit